MGVFGIRKMKVWELPFLFISPIACNKKFPQ